MGIATATATATATTQKLLLYPAATSRNECDQHENECQLPTSFRSKLFI